MIYGVELNLLIVYVYDYDVDKYDETVFQQDCEGIAVFTGDELSDVLLMCLSLSLTDFIHSEYCKPFCLPIFQSFWEYCSWFTWKK